MRRAGSSATFNVGSHVLAARAKLSSHAHLYVLALLLSLFALVSFFSAPHHKSLTLPDRSTVQNGTTAMASHVAAAKAAAAQAQAAAASGGDVALTNALTAGTQGTNATSAARHNNNDAQRNQAAAATPEEG